MLFFVDIVVVWLLCRNSTFELVVDCMRAGLEKKAGGGGGRSPRAKKVGGGRSAPPFANVLASRQQKALKRGCGVLIVVITLEVSRTKIKQA